MTYAEGVNHRRNTPPRTVNPESGWPAPDARVVYLGVLSAGERDELLDLANDPRAARLMGEVVEQAAYLELTRLHLGRILTRALGGGLTGRHLALLTGLGEDELHRLVPSWFTDLDDAERARVTASGTVDNLGSSRREEWLERLTGG